MVQGDIGGLFLPEGMSEVELRQCKGITGDISHLVLPADIQYVLSVMKRERESERGM